MHVITKECGEAIQCKLTNKVYGKLKIIVANGVDRRAEKLQKTKNLPSS